MQRGVPCFDMDQLDENQPYYDESAASLSSGSSCERHASGQSLALSIDADNMACVGKLVTSEFTSF